MSDTRAAASSSTARSHRRLGPAGLPVAGREPEPIVRGRLPLDAETPVEVFGREFTPNRLFFVRSHFGRAGRRADGEVVARDRRGVRQSLALTLDDLAKLEQVTIPAVLQCSGNGRSCIRPTVPASAGARGRWATRSGPGSGWPTSSTAPGVGRDGARPPARGRRPADAEDARLLRSIPIGPSPGPGHAARHPDERRAAADPPRRAGPPGGAGLVGEPLDQVAAEARSSRSRRRRGLTCDRLQDAESGRSRRGSNPKPEDMVTLTAMNVKSLITSPAEGSVVGDRRVFVRGRGVDGGARRS